MAPWDDLSAPHTMRELGATSASDQDQQIADLKAQLLASQRTAAELRGEREKLKEALRRADSKAERYSKDALLLERVYAAATGDGGRVSRLHAVEEAFGNWKPGHVHG